VCNQKFYLPLQKLIEVMNVKEKAGDLLIDIAKLINKLKSKRKE